MTDTIRFDVEGMTCASCAVRIERVLGKQDGVESAVVNFAGQEARATVTDGADIETLKAAETLLKQAAQNPMARDKVMKNLALVLELQGRKAEAQALAQGGADALRRSLEPTAQPSPVQAVAQATRR